MPADGLLPKASVAIDGSKFKAVNNRDKNFTSAKIERRRKQLEESVSRYLSQLDTADRQDPSETLTLKTVLTKEKLEKLKSEMDQLAAIEKQVLALADQQLSLIDPDSRSMATSGRCVPYQPNQSSLRDGKRASHHAMGKRGACRDRAGKARQKSGCHAHAP